MNPWLLAWAIGAILTLIVSCIAEARNTGSLKLGDVASILVFAIFWPALVPLLLMAVGDDIVLWKRKP